MSVVALPPDPGLAAFFSIPWVPFRYTPGWFLATASRLKM
jgi:hypothetical protein